MGYRVKGTLKLPNGTPGTNCEIEFTSRKNFTPVLTGMGVSVRTDSAGAYDVTLEYGAYAVILRTGNTYPTAIGQFIVASDTVVGQDLPTLLEQSGWQPATPEYIQQITKWMDRAESAATRSEASAVKSADDGVAQAALAKSQADRAKSEADRAAQISGLSTVEQSLGVSPYIRDMERHAVERASGGKQTVIRDAAGNSNVMFVLPRFRYEGLSMDAVYGKGDVTAFDTGAGAIKDVIFIGAYQASGNGAVSQPRQLPRTGINHTQARKACADKGAGWHLMTMHEWAAIALWCMANGYEPIGNTNWGRSHAKTWIVGDKGDGKAPGDTSGLGRTRTGSLGVDSSHDRTLGGIFDLVGNVWEWQDGLLMMDGQLKVSQHNLQAEADWALQEAYLDASTPTGGNVILSHQITNMVGAAGDNQNAGNSASTDWRVMTKSPQYVTNQLLKRLLVEPAGAQPQLPQGRIYARNFGERLPIRGGPWDNGAHAGLAALALNYSSALASTVIGFRPAFA